MNKTFKYDPKTESEISATSYIKEDRIHESLYEKMTTSVPIQSFFLVVDSKAKRELEEFVKDLNISVTKDSREAFERLINNEESVTDLKKVLKPVIKGIKNPAGKDYYSSIGLVVDKRKVKPFVREGMKILVINPNLGLKD